MPIADLFGLLAKRQTTPDKFLASSVNVVAGGQAGALRAPFNQERGVRAYRSWVYAAATINAQAVAALPLRLYVKRGEGGVMSRAIPNHRKRYLLGDMANDVRPSLSVVRKAANYADDLEEVTGSHPLTDLLASANPFLNGFDLATLRILFGELTGNAYMHPIIDEATGVPTELWPLAPQYIEVIPDEDEFISGYLYGIDATKKQVFEPDEVIHFRRPNPGNLYYGLGKVEAAYGAVQANEAVHAMDLSTFENSARPDYAVVVKGSPTGDQLDRFQTQVEQRLKGARKDGSFITVTGDVQFTPLNFPPKDLAGREEIVEEIAAVFGVPVSMLKANDPNLASATSGFAQWREGTVLPLCRMDEEELNQSLLPLFGLDDRYCLAYDNPVPADKAYELQERQTAVAGGWRTPNEARLDEGREEVDEDMANRLLVNGQPLGASVAAPGLDLPAFDAGPAEPVEAEEAEPVEAPEPDATAAPVEEAAAPLNGAQVASIVAVLDGVAGGNVSPIAAIELISASGLPREAATRMVEAQAATAKPEGQVDAEIEAEAPAGDAAKILDERKCGRVSEYAAIKLLQASGLSRKEADRLVSKAIADVDLKPTTEMAELAQRGLDLRDEHGRGGTEVGVARARDLSNRENLSPETVGRMANFFSRHRVDLDAPAASAGHDDYPSAGVIAWLLWGGDPANPDEAGAAWADRKMSELEAAEEKGAGGTDGKSYDDGAGWHAFYGTKSYAGGRPCCPSHTKTVRAYEWPEATKFARLEIEGLDDDFDRLRPKAADADDDVRDGERRTPAMRIRDAVAAALGKTADAVEEALLAGSFGRAPEKASTRPQAVRRLVRGLEGVSEDLTRKLGEFFESAAEGGNRVATSRLNEILSRQGAGRIGAPTPSAALTESIVKRATALVDDLIEGSVRAFADGLDADFSIDEEIRRLRGYGFSPERATVVARTESANAYQEGQVDAWKETGIVDRKAFLKAPGACQFCESVSKRYGASPIGLDDPMVRAGETITGSEGGTLKPKFDSQGIVHPNCRCDFVPVLED